MLDLVSQNMKLIEEISNESSSEYIDLPSYFRRFQYPVSLELSKYAGQRAYQRGMLDSLEFFCILTNKVYTRIIAERKAKGLVGFILKEKEGFSKKASQLILSIKKWECGQIDDDHLAQAIENFCLETTGVRLPVVSFFS